MDTQQTRSSITCDVKNCVYNSKNHCAAADVHVGPTYAVSSNDTVCDTFRPNECQTM